MKKSVLLLAWVFYALFLPAQTHRTWPAGPKPGETLRHLVAPLDKNEVSSGFLLDQSLNGLVEPTIFDGLRRDSVYLQPTTFGLLYAMTRRGHVGAGANPLPASTVYMDRIAHYAPTDTIPLAFLAWQYQRIKNNALSDSLLVLQEEQFHDVPGRTQSPYGTDTLWAFAPLIADARSSRVHYVLPTDLIWQNLGWSDALFQADFGDGAGWRSLTPGQTCIVQYAESGAKIVSLRIQKASFVYECQSVVFVAVTPAVERVTGPNYSDTPQTIISVNSDVDIRIFYGTPCQKLLKPFIIVEGFELVDNPDQFRVQLADLLSKKKVFGGMPEISLGEWLYDQGYDLVWINLADVQGYIQDNAEAVNAAIAKINQIKTSNGSSEPNMIMGVSAGGIIAKYALLKAQQTGFDHQCEKFFSYDSPLRGANIPVSIQAFLHHINFIATDQGIDLLAEVPEVAVAFNALNSPFARQMLLYRFYYQPGTNDWILSSQEHDEFMAEVDAMGSLDIRHIALANGSAGTLIENNISPGSLMFEAHTYGYTVGVYVGIIPPVIIPWNVGVYFDVEAFALSNNSGDVLYDGNLKIKIWDITFKQFPLYIEVPENEKSYDTAPGGSNNLGLSDISKFNNIAIPTIIVPVPLPNGWVPAVVSMSPLSLTTYATHFAFIPTRSSLGINDNVSINGAFNCGQSTANRCSYSTDATPNNYVSTPEINQQHVFLDARIGDILVDELDAANLIPGGMLPANLMAYYNAGLQVQSGIPTMTISTAAGSLNINNTGKVGYGLGNEPDSPFDLFHAYTKCEAQITVEASSKLVIGAEGATKHGTLSVLPNSIVHIKPGGTLRITSDQSALIIHPGATLILDPGAIVRLESPDAKIRIEGRLIVNGDIDFAGTGYFEFAGSNQLEYGPGYTTFRLAGAGIAQRFIRIESELRVPAGRNIDLRQGAVQIDGERLALPEGSGGSFTDIHFYGAAANGVQGDHSASFYASGCRFDGFAYPIHLSGGTGTARLLSCTLGDYTGIGVFSADRPQLLLEQCSFNSPWANDGVYSKYTTLVVQRQTTITGAQSGTYGNNGPAPNGDPLLSPPAKTGVRLEGGWLYWMDGGEISGADVGIANLDGYPTNVYMNHFATIRDCYAGIVMRGNATTGLVAMNCARLINNYYGIHGRDVALMIDPALFNGQSQQAANANVFIRPVSYGPVSGSEYFHICYGLKTPPNPVPATQNYWGSFDGANVSADPSPSDHKTFCYNPASTGGCGVSTAGCTLIGMNTAPRLDRQPAGCPQPGFVCEDPDGNCDESCSIVVTGGEASTVRDQFLAAMDELHNEDFPAAKSGFQPPADLWGPGSLSFSTVCRSYVDAARSLTDGAAPGNGEERRAPVGPAARLRLSPNPAAESVAVLLDGAEDYELEVWDMQGRLMYRARVAGAACRLDVADWPAGLYLVKTERGGMMEWGRLSVVR